MLKMNHAKNYILVLMMWGTLPTETCFVVKMAEVQGTEMLGIL
jgi:hypothetical protein